MVARQFQRALERHQENHTTKVIPIILRPAYWQGMLGRLQALPTNGVPVTDPHWRTKDEALLNIVEGIIKVVEDLLGSAQAKERREGPAPPVFPWRRLRIVVGSVIGFVLTIVGMVSFFVVFDEALNPPPPIDLVTGFTMIGICIGCGTFLFCTNAPALIGRSIAIFALSITVLLFLTGPFMAHLAGILDNFVGGTIISLLGGFFSGQHARENGERVSKPRIELLPSAGGGKVRLAV
jgi:hypothetical protein